MSTTLTENAANADFSTGLVVPTNGDDFTAACAVVVAAAQELADREQAIRLMLGATTGASVVRSVPLVQLTPSITSGWTQGFSTNSLWYYQHNLGTSIFFGLHALPVGAKLVSITARIAGGNPMGLAISTHSALPAVMPTLKLWSQADGVATQIGSTATDASADVSAYNAMHSLTCTVNHTVLSAASYWIELAGENSTNAVVDGCQLAQVYTTVQPV
jgi:hypothetical protein